VKRDERLAGGWRCQRFRAFGRHFANRAVATTKGRLAFGVWRLAFGVWRLAFGVWRLAFGVWRLAFPAFPALPALFLSGIHFINSE
jgi:hypothetical protein